MKLTISNRLLNEISLFMKEDGYNSIAKEYIDPIVAETAGKGLVNATIESESIIGDIQFFIGKMEKQGNRAVRLIEQHLQIAAA